MTDAEIAKRCNAALDGEYMRQQKKRVAIGWALLGAFSFCSWAVSIWFDLFK
jgi:hypothetical protein